VREAGQRSTAPHFQGPMILTMDQWTSHLAC
jgi:hypothetical protein